MSRYLTKKEDGTYIEEIEFMDMCKWLVDDICCNGDCDCVSDYPYPSSMCELDENGENLWCNCFEKEDGIVKKK